MPTISIYYDLETSSLSPVGQILNYSFCVVDENWKVLDEFSGKIKVSRGQLPEPEAILANRVDVLELQEDPTAKNERDSMYDILMFIEKSIKKYGVTSLIGYNNIRFDLPYLRTSLIRNGLNPYFKQSGGDWTQLDNKDVLHAVQFCMIGNTGFRNLIHNHLNLENPNKLSLTLQTVCSALGILKGKQLHESKFDVALTIALAKELAINYDIDIRSLRNYAPQSTTICNKAFPNYDLTTGQSFLSATMANLDDNKNYSLWIDLDKYKDGKGRESIQWFNKKTSTFFISYRPIKKEYNDLAEKALEEFAGINLENFFPEKNCDAEAFIYMVSFKGIEALRAAIWQKNYEPIKALDDFWTNELYRRYLINNYTWRNEPENIKEAARDKKILDMLKDYAEYRYGGEMKINKFDTESEWQEGIESEDFHPPLKMLVTKIKNLTPEDNTHLDYPLMKSLLKFYKDSDIVKLFGKELLKKEETTNETSTV